MARLWFASPARPGCAPCGLPPRRCPGFSRGSLERDQGVGHQRDPVAVQRSGERRNRVLPHACAARGHGRGVRIVVGERGGQRRRRRLDRLSGQGVERAASGRGCPRRLHTSARPWSHVVSANLQSDCSIEARGSGAGAPGMAAIRASSPSPRPREPMALAAEEATATSASERSGKEVRRRAPGSPRSWHPKAAMARTGPDLSDRRRRRSGPPRSSPMRLAARPRGHLDERRLRFRKRGELEEAAGGGPGAAGPPGAGGVAAGALQKRKASVVAATNLQHRINLIAGSFLPLPKAPGLYGSRFQIPCSRFQGASVTWNLPVRRRIVMAVAGASQIGLPDGLVASVRRHRPRA